MKGRSRTLRVVKALAAAGFQADQAISSPYLRAMETAWLAHRGGLAPPPVPCARLQPGGPGMDRLADIAGPLLRLLETEGVANRTLGTTPLGDSDEVPLAFAARLVTGGALEDLLGLLDTVLGGASVQ